MQLDTACEVTGTAPSPSESTEILRRVSALSVPSTGNAPLCLSPWHSTTTGCEPISVAAVEFSIAAC
jgi:hypothetical protein